MKYIYEKGIFDNVFLLLYGIGGNEYDFFLLGWFIDFYVYLFGVRGLVFENGMLCFFKCLSEGVFDEKDFVEWIRELKNFIDEVVEMY